MAKSKIFHRVIKTLLKGFCFAFCVAGLLLAPAVSAFCETKATGTILGVNVQQVADSLVVFVVEGNEITMPEITEENGYSAVLTFSDCKFKNKTEKVDIGLPLIEFLKIEDDSGILKIKLAGLRKLVLAKSYGPIGAEKIILEFKPDENAKNSDYRAENFTKWQNKNSAVLKQKISVNVNNINCMAAVKMTADLIGLNTYVDKSADKDATVSLEFKDVAAKEILDFLLVPLNCDYAIVNGTIAVAENNTLERLFGGIEHKEYKIDYADVNAAASMVNSIVSLAKPAIVDTRRRSIFVSATPVQHGKIESFLNRYDMPGKQIMLEARLLEIENGAASDYEGAINAVYKGWLLKYSGTDGLNLGYGYSNRSLTTTGTTDSDTDTTTSETAASFTTLDAADHVLKLFDANFTALESRNKGRILAKPVTIVMDGEKSVIKLTHNYLYQSGVDRSRNPQFSTQETGPTLEILPTVGRDGFVTMKIKITTGQIVSFRQSGDSEAPETTNREVETTIRLRNGEPFVIGGLNQETETKTKQNVPWLSQIPLLGGLFRYSSKDIEKSQMIFIVVPRFLDVPSGKNVIYKLNPTDI